jgi:non-homologous end joining protein Ku
MKELGIEPAAVSEAEMTLANQLVQHLSVKRFDPNEFVDEFKARAEAAIQHASSSRRRCIQWPATPQ